LQNPATTEDASSQPERSWTDTGGHPLKITELRAKLYSKAKREPGFRFYSLYGQILRSDVLWAAWARVAANDGSPGVDNVTIDAVVKSPEGPAALIEIIEQELRARTYRPAAVKRVLIPKANGKLRPLGIPTVKDRVVQTAVKIVLEPIFEADFLECSHGFRPGRSAQDALVQVVENIRDGREAIYDADLSSYFDTIPHDKLMACVERRVADRSVLALIRLWLNAEVEEEDENGGPPRRHRPKAGTPQGGVISPLLANLYLHWFDKLFHRDDGPRWWANARLVRYADDFAVQARYIGDQLRTWVETLLEGRFGLTINRTKTSVKQVDPTSSEAMDFLGYRIWHAPDRFGGDHRYLTALPSPKAMEAERKALRKIICKKNGMIPIMG
jgi:RNA-directed DNA polymerase